MVLDYTWILDVVGLALAVIGFLDLAPRCERFFRWLKDEAQEFADYAKELRRELWRFSESWRYLVFGAIRATVRVAVIVFFTALFSGSLGALIAAIPKWPWWGYAVAAPVVLAGEVILFALSCLFGRSLLLWLSVVIWRLFAVLSIPPSGVLGSIGLLLAGVSFAINRLPLWSAA